MMKISVKYKQPILPIFCHFSIFFETMEKLGCGHNMVSFIRMEPKFHINTLVHPKMLTTDETWQNALPNRSNAPNTVYFHPDLWPVLRDVQWDGGLHGDMREHQPHTGGHHAQCHVWFIRQVNNCASQNLQGTWLFQTLYDLILFLHCFIIL